MSRSHLAASGSCSSLIAQFSGSADPEVRSTSTVHPKTAAVHAPRVAFDAGRAADLALQANITGAAYVTPVSATVVRRAVDYTSLHLGAATSHEELSAASTVDPEAATVDAPRVALDTGGAAELASEANVSITTYVTPVSAAVV
jgi:hypothetical protein